MPFNPAPVVPGAGRTSVSCSERDGKPKYQCQEYPFHKSTKSSARVPPDGFQRLSSFFISANPLAVIGCLMPFPLKMAPKSHFLGDFFPRTSFLSYSGGNGDPSARRSGGSPHSRETLFLGSGMREGIHGAMTDLGGIPAHQSSRCNPLVKSKWRSRLRIGRLCWRDNAAIHRSLEGIGAPACFNSLRSSAYRMAVS